MTKYEEFISNAKSSIDDHRREIRGNGGFDYNEQVKMLTSLQNKLNTSLMIYLFGEQLGPHYAIVFYDNGRNLLSLFSKMDSEAQFFILHELKTNLNLFANC